MKYRLHTLLKSPYKDSDGTHNEAVVLNVLILGTLWFLGLTLAVSIISYVYSRDPAVGIRIFSTLVFLIFTVMLYIGAHTWKWPLLLTARLLVSFYVVIVGIILVWLGTANPTGLLLAGFIIPLAGILLGARYALGMVVFITSLVVLVMAYNPPADLKPEMVVLRCIILGGIFMMMGLISWLFIGAVQHSRARAKRYERDLIQERDSLEVKVRERTRELEAAQLEKLQHMHRFTELGYISTATLHDLANHVSAITLDAELLEGQVKATALDRIKRNLSYIEDDVIKAREHIRGEKTITEFNVHDEITELVRILRHNNHSNEAVIEYQAPQSRGIMYRGYKAGLRQVLSGLIMNAVESYTDETTPKHQVRHVLVQVTSSQKQTEIKVTDTGRGISRKELAHIFDPFYSTKLRGMGMGLYIAKQVVEQDLNGSLDVQSAENKGTTFTITLPVA